MLRKLCAGTGYAIQSSKHDTDNILCRHGHIYADRGRIVASLNHATPEQSRLLRRLGDVIADGDGGELSAAVDIERFYEVCAILKPRQKSVLAKKRGMTPRAFDKWLRYGDVAQPRNPSWNEGGDEFATPAAARSHPRGRSAGPTCRQRE